MHPLDDVIDDWITLPDLADRTGESISKVRTLLREGRLVAVRRGEPAVLQVPALFAQPTGILKGLGGLVTVMRDNGYSDEELLRWLFTPDESLPGRPVDALVENRGTEVKRRAQALGF